MEKRGPGDSWSNCLASKRPCVHTATATALLSALPEGRCPGLRGWARATLVVSRSAPHSMCLSLGPEGGTWRDCEWPWRGVENGLGVSGAGGGEVGSQGSLTILPRV